MLEVGPILLVDAGLGVSEPDAPQVAIVLAEAGYMVQSCDVAGAVEAAKRNHPALVVLDADATGAMDLLSTFRKMDETARVPVLLVGVAGKTIQSARDAILRGADAFYSRPIDARRVLLKVETYLGMPDDSERPTAVGSPGAESAAHARPTQEASPPPVPVSPERAGSVPAGVPDLASEADLPAPAAAHPTLPPPAAPYLAPPAPAPPAPEPPAPEPPAPEPPAPEPPAPAPPAPSPSPSLRPSQPLPFEPEVLAEHPAGVRPEATFVLNDALVEAGTPVPPDDRWDRNLVAGGEAMDAEGAKRVRTLPPPTEVDGSLGDRLAGDEPAAEDKTPAEGRPATLPFVDAIAHAEATEAEKAAEEGLPPSRDVPPVAGQPFDAGLSEDLREVLRSMERKLFPDAPPLVVPDIASDDPDELVPSSLLEGLDVGPDDAEDEQQEEASEEIDAVSMSPSLPLPDTVDLAKPTAAAPAEPAPTPVPAGPPRERIVAPGRRDSLPPAPPPEVQEAEGARLVLHGRVASSGDLSRDDPAQIFAAALAARMTGRIRFRQGRMEKVVHLVVGRPIVASSNVVEDRLVEGLYRTGRLPRAAYERVRATIAGTGRRAGAVLVEMGLVKREELVPVVRSHLEEVLFTVYGWEAGTWTCEPGTLDADEHIRMESPAAALIVEGVRLRYGARRVERLLGGPSTILARRAAGIVPIGEVRLLPEERATLEACDGKRPLEQVIRMAGGTLDHLGPALWSLISLGFLEVSARGMPTDVAVDAPMGQKDVERQIERRRVEERLTLARVGDYFSLLGIARTAGGHEIRRAYLDLSRAFDPTRFADPTLADLVGAAHEILAALDDAYEVLRDSVLRDAYRSHLVD